MATARQLLNDDQVTAVLAKHGEPLDDTTVWRVQGRLVVYHDVLERIAQRSHIEFDLPTIIHATDDHAVLIVQGHITAVDSGAATGHAWSSGEARVIRAKKERGNLLREIVGGFPAIGNYIVTDGQPAYPYAMAEKRAKDRVILKLIGLHGSVYSESEADEFAPPAAPPPPEETPEMKALKKEVDKINSPEVIEIYMKSEVAKKTLATLTDDQCKDVRAHAYARMKKLGWKPKPNEQRERPKAEATTQTAGGTVSSGGTQPHDDAPDDQDKAAVDALAGNPPHDAGDQHVVDPEAVLKSLRAELAAVNELPALEDTFNRIVSEEVWDGLLPPDQDALTGEFRRHVERIKGTTKRAPRGGSKKGK